ncbi:uncharacterized protein [Littorina saxatilis]|uniref:Uncharacterized protein n=2 Tax=Littorina saxatilis TaxID=31220 RepID=A0AAN9APE3_9CAEN
MALDPGYFAHYTRGQFMLQLSLSNLKKHGSLTTSTSSDKSSISRILTTPQTLENENYCPENETVASSISVDYPLLQPSNQKTLYDQETYRPVLNPAAESRSEVSSTAIADRSSATSAESRSNVDSLPLDEDYCPDTESETGASSISGLSSP